MVISAHMSCIWVLIQTTNLVKQVYARYPDQRITILEEILSSLIKLPHGKKIFKGFKYGGAFAVL